MSRTGRLVLALVVIAALGGAATVEAAPTQGVISLPPPAAPLERASGDGVSILVGSNGVVEFRATSVPSSVAAALGRGSVSYGCFLGAGSGGFKSTFATVRRFRFQRPLDRCEIEASYGRLWPDRFRSHAAVEVALTDRGRAYFADRAAARDLALFIRTGLTYAIRREGGDAFARAVTARYGRTITRLASPTAPIRANRIGYTPTPSGATLVERSSTGKRFSVELAGGHIEQQHLLPYTFLVLFQARR
jgi:hypothetical protein